MRTAGAETATAADLAQHVTPVYARLCREREERYGASNTEKFPQLVEVPRKFTLVGRIS